MNRDTLKQIMVDQKDIYLNDPLIARHYPLEEKYKLLLCRHQKMWQILYDVSADTDLT